MNHQRIRQILKEELEMANAGSGDPFGRILELLREIKIKNHELFMIISDLEKSQGWDRNMYKYFKRVAGDFDTIRRAVDSARRETEYWRE